MYITDEGKVHDVNDEEENKNHESEVKDLRESEAVNKDFVVKMLKYENFHLKCVL